MILRRREKQTLDALEELATFLRDVREERKAVITITDGWRLYTPDRTLRGRSTRPRPWPLSNVNPRNGRLTTKDTPNTTGGTRANCEADRYTLSELNDQQRIRTIYDEANRANVSFYPIDPRGLAVFDEPIVPTAGVGIGRGFNPTLSSSEENARLFERSTSLRGLAEATDGLAIVGSNDIEKGFKRIIDDMSAYCLLGYYSTGKLDGRFHSIRVRVKRPGVEVRARRGYLAPSAADAARGLLKAPTAGAPGAENAIATAAAAAVATLPAAARDQPLRVHVTAGWRPAGEGSAGQPQAAFWMVTEVADRIPGSDIDAVLTHRGEVVGSARGRIAPGAVSLLMPIAATGRLDAGDYQVRVRSQTPGGVETLTVPVTLPPASSASGAVYMRRGPSSGNKDLPTADLRYRRSDGCMSRCRQRPSWLRRGCSIGPGSPFPSRWRQQCAMMPTGHAGRAPKSRSRRWRREIIWSKCRAIPRERSCRSGWCLEGSRFRRSRLIGAADVEAQRPGFERLLVGAQNPVAQFDADRPEPLEGFRELQLEHAARAVYCVVNSAVGVVGSPRSAVCDSR